MGVGKDARHGYQGERRGDTGGTTPPAAGHLGNDRHQRRKTRRRRQPAREDVLTRRVRPLPEDLEGFSHDRGDPQQPAAQRGMLGVVAKDAVDRRTIEKAPAQVVKRFEIGPSGPHVQRLIHCQPGSVQGQHHGQTRTRPECKRQPPGRPQASSRCFRPGGTSGVQGEIALDCKKTH